MKELVDIDINWLGYDFSRRDKSAEELDHDQQFVRQVLRKMGYDRMFQSTKPFYEFVFEKSDKALEILIEELNKRPDLASPHIRIEKRYSRQELEAAELLLWRSTSQDIEDDYYGPYSGRTSSVGVPFQLCGTCGAPLRQVRPLIIKKSLMKKRDVSFTYSFEVILAERLRVLLQDMGVTGFELWPVQPARKPYHRESTLYQLKITDNLPPMASPPTEFESIKRCDVCGRMSQFLKHTHQWGKIKYYEDTDVYYQSCVMDVVKDFNNTTEWFGELPLSTHSIIITQRVYRILREHKIKDWEAVPVYLVE